MRLAFVVASNGLTLIGETEATRADLPGAILLRNPVQHVSQLRGDRASIEHGYACLPYEGFTGEFSVSVVPILVLFASEMTDTDQAEMRARYDAGRRAIDSARLARSGLVLGKVSLVPRGAD
jgi:hypothetical protein